MIEDVHSRCAQVDEVLSQVRDRCEGFVTAAKDKAQTIEQDAQKRTEAMRKELALWEEEKSRIATTRTFDAMVKLNVGGHLFTTTLATLTRFPTTMLGAMFSGRHALVKDENGAYFIDRDGRHFHEILNFLRAPAAYTTDAMNDRMKTELKIEADYYGLKDLIFPAPPAPPFVKAAPVTMTTPQGVKVVVTQDDAGLWYMEVISTVWPFPRCLLNVCNTCGWGIPSSQHHPAYGIPRFTTGRTITDAQPRKTGACNWDGRFCQ